MHNFNTKQSRTPVRAADGRVVGWVEKDTLRKNVNASRHMLQNPRGWAWDVSILDNAEKKGVMYTEIHDQETQVVYHASLQAFRRYGVKLERGFGPQICLPLTYWQVTRQGETWGQQLNFDW